ncbi:MAG: hypothetical protein CMP38_03010 [Rickettsiales bacterium]|nr:hypothetical protein [Rickettsiales bacterium]
MLRFLKFSFFIFTVFLILIAILPFFIDKQKIASLVEDRLKNDFKINLSFDKNISLNFFPKPTLKIFSIKYLDDKSNIEIIADKINLVATWTSIINLKPEIESLEVFSPVVKFNKTNKFTKSKNLFFVKNEDDSLIKNLKSKLENFGVIKISQGLINFSDYSIKNVNLIFKSESVFKVKGDFEFTKLASKVIFDLVEKDNFFDFIIQQKISDRNIIQYRGKLNFFGKHFLINGQGRSNFVNVNEISNLFGHLSSFSIPTMRLVNVPVTGNEINLNFKIDKLKINEAFLKSTEFDLKLLNDILKIKKFKANYNDASIYGDLNFSLKNNNFSGKTKIQKLLVIKEYFGLSKIDLFDGLVDCSITYKGSNSSNDFEKTIKSIDSKGTCTTGKIKVSGVDFAQIAKTVDKINDFPSLIKIINKKNFGKESKFEKITLKFDIKNGYFYLKPLKAYHKNLTLNSSGKFNILEDHLILDSKAYFKTTKYKDLPAVGISMIGPSETPQVSYDLSELKQKIFNEGFKKILKEKKSIIVDPDVINDFFKKNLKKEFDPAKIIDLFSN